MRTLVFIDTNIYLDFYRFESREAGLGILGKIHQHGQSLITTEQVFMEFNKNRQKVLLDVHGRMRAPDWDTMRLPPVLADSKASRALEKHKKGVKDQAVTLKKRLQRILQSPSSYDPVFRTVQMLARTKSDHNLDRQNDLKVEIREHAEKRHRLGYPPRKPGDTSIGDAINWEWIVHCAQHSGSGVVIVSRDADYGQAIDRNPVINDWLREEFRDRVGKRRKIILTDRLSVGLKEASIPLSKVEEAAEEVVLENPKQKNRTGLAAEWLDYLAQRNFGAVINPSVLAEDISVYLPGGRKSEES